MDIKLKEAGSQDIEQLQQIGRQTFYETFIEWNTEENVRMYIDESFATERLAAELKDTNSEFWLAADNGRVIGYLKVNSGHAQTELQDDRAIEIERIYVLKEYQGKGVAQLLYNKAIQIATIKEAEYVWLGVWENNLRAINFYRKNGFFVFDEHPFRMGKEVQTDLMMKLPLDS